MVYFSFDDFVDCEQSEEIYKVRKLGENVVKYEQISKTGKNENSIIEIIKKATYEINIINIINFIIIDIIKLVRL